MHMMNIKKYNKKSANENVKRIKYRKGETKT